MLGWEAIKEIFASSNASECLDTLLTHADCDGSSEEFVIDLGGPTLMDQWAPKIAEMRAEGTKWTEIVEITGLDLNRAYRSWKRFVDAQKTTDATGGDSAIQTDDHSSGAGTDADEAA